MEKIKQYLLNRKTWSRGLFFIMFLMSFWIYDLDRTFFVHPQSIHIWRQTNSLSIAQNFYDHNNSLFQPQLHSQFCGDGISGKSAGEFPLIYYTVAKLWKVFGVHEWIFRLVQLLIILGGLWAVFEISMHFIKHSLLSIFIGFILFTSPMLVFYGINFLPDGPSLSMMFIGWYFVLRNYLTRKMIWLWVAAFFFSLAVMTKITIAYSLIALVIWILYEWFFLPKELRIFNYRLKQIIPYFVIIGLSVAWYWYVEYYNELNQGEFSYHGIWPIWRMTDSVWAEIKDAVSVVFFYEYANPYLQYLTFVLWLVLIINFRKNPKFLNWMLILLPMGALSVLLLWFQVLNAHDYYLIIMLLVIPFVWISFFFSFKNNKWLKHPVIVTILFLFLGYNIYTCQERLENRYQGWMNDGYLNHMDALTELEPLFKQLNIGKDDRIISIPDPSVTASLYYMNRPGFTDYGTDFSKESDFRKRINQGSKFLVVNDTTILDRPVIKDFLLYPIGKYRNVKIFNLRPFKQ